MGKSFAPHTSVPQDEDAHNLTYKQPLDSTVDIIAPSPTPVHSPPDSPPSHSPTHPPHQGNGPVIPAFPFSWERQGELKMVTLRAGMSASEGDWGKCGNQKFTISLGPQSTGAHL